MNHCVGGYSRKVLHGASVIIACKNAENQRFTIELSPIDKDKEKYKIIQIQKRFNKRTKFKECRELLKIINNSYKIFPLNSSSKNVFKNKKKFILNNIAEVNEDELPF